MNRFIFFKFLTPILSFFLFSVFTTKAQVTDLVYPGKLNNHDRSVKGLNGEPAPFRPSGALPRLRVSDNKRFLVTEAGNPFFWLGDTGWRLFQSLDREEVDKYFENRAAQQFSIVLAHILPWEQGETNTYGEPAFVNNDFNKPNEKYWKHADYIVEQASAKGLYLGLLPMWCLNYIERKNGSSLIDAPAAYAYGVFLSKRYGHKTHLVWILGGDAPPVKHDIYDALAKGITDGTGGEPDKVLISYHPPSRLKSTGAFYHDRPWLDFNMLQSGHDIWRLSYETTAEDYARRPIKPTVDAEPNYENHPIRHKFENGVFTAYHMRMKAYWGVFAGGFGFTYGGNGIWQMDKAGKEPFLKTHANLSWDKAIDLPGSQQMKYLRQLMESRPFLSRVPDKNIMLLSTAGEKEARIEATYGQDRSWAMFYLTTGQPLRINLANMKAKRINAWWFNPRDGKTYDNDGKVTAKPFYQFKKSKGKGSFDPPGNTGDENDWILVLDDAAKHYPVPGLSASR